jgi:hypothetical protein
MRVDRYSNWAIRTATSSRRSVRSSLSMILTASRSQYPTDILGIAQSSRSTLSMPLR